MCIVLDSDDVVHVSAVQDALDWQRLGRELVQSAAHGNVLVCRRILAEEKTRRDAAASSQTKSIFGQPVTMFNATGEILPPNEGPPAVFTNFMCEGHCALQAAAQNGHVDVCKLLVGEYAADIEFEVFNMLSIYYYRKSLLTQNKFMIIIYLLTTLNVIIVIQKIVFYTII